MPNKRYQWKVLPQGLSNSTALCQQLLEIIYKQFPQSIIRHYIDDILLADSNRDTLEQTFDEEKKFVFIEDYKLLLKKKNTEEILWIT